MFNKVHWNDITGESDIVRLDEEKKPKLKIPELSEIAPTQPCVLCVEKEVLQSVTESLDVPLSSRDTIKRELLQINSLNDFSEILHNVSGCHLPAARRIIHKRYQQ
ncbi:hypothetical protein PV325_013984 [Microctonus aethiopoides]|nr:hypothetical protein PV325_013984 [Microctonus aethiopoides]